MVLAVAGASLTKIGPWYQSLNKPAWKPPDWAFGPVWTAIFALSVVAGVKGWQADEDPRARRRLVTAFAINGGLNILWSALFFTMRRPDLSLAEAVALWLSVAAIIWLLYPRTKAGALCMTPYLVWVSIATVLNYQIVELNGPF